VFRPQHAVLHLAVRSGILLANQRSLKKGP
jgi:hypothetical protein